jgi:Bacterial Ig-like domain (group 3)/Galactose oxidase, central domain
MLALNRHRCWTALSLAFLFCFGLCFPSRSAYAGAEPKNLEVIDMPAAPSDAEMSNARAAFRSGKSIVRIKGGQMANALRMLQVQLPDVQATTASSNRPIPKNTASGGETLKLKAVAAYIDGNGTVRSVETFAPENGDDTKWQGLLEKWTTQEISRAAVGTQAGDPAPPEEAWTTLYVTTVQASSTGGAEEDTISVYRLNTQDATKDTYLVYTVPTVQPAWHGNCDGIEECDWHTYSRLLGTSLTPNALVTDHGPTGTINTSSASFSIGVGSDPSATFGASWSQPDVVTTDQTAVNGNKSQWDEEFGNADIRCNPAFGRVPDTSSGTFLSRQGTIYTVPAGTSSIQVSAFANAEFCGYGVRGGGIDDFFDYSNSILQFSITLGPPVLSAIPQSLTIPPSGSAALSVGAYIPNSPQGLEWTIASNQAWLTLDSQGPFDTSQVINVSVSAGTSNGSTGTLSIDTQEPFAAPAVQSGPILVNVTVGTPPTTSRAGVLLIGGVGSSLNVAGTIFYDVNAKQVLSVGQPNVPRYDHTATQLNSDEILIVGGATAVEPDSNTMLQLTAVSELFEPATMSFKTVGSLTTARYFHSAVLLPDGKVLIVGGIDQTGAPVQNAELYDPASGTFSAAGVMSSKRVDSSATLISGPDEPAQVLVYGGTVVAGTGAQDSTEIWSEASKSFGAGPNLVFPQLDFPTPVESSPGNFEVVGGGNDSGSSTASTQILEAPSTFRQGPNLTYPRDGNALTALANDVGVLTTGGAGNYTAELKQGDIWTLLSGNATCPGAPGCMVEDRKRHTSTLLPDGTIFIAGGENGTNAALGSTEIFAPTTKQFTAGPVIPPQARQTASFISTSEVTLLALPSPAGFGKQVTLAATVTVATGEPSGKVTFFDGASSLGTVSVLHGTASLETAALGVGSHSLTALYSEDAVNSPATSAPFVEVIGQETTNTLLSSSENPSDVGQLVRFTATVTAQTAPTGSVSFTDGENALGAVALSGNTAVYSTSSLTSGSHVITATYMGDATHVGSSSLALNQGVIENTTTTALTVTPTTGSYGQSVSLKAAVTGTGSITGSVLFRDGSTRLGSVNLTNQQATLSISSLGGGGHSITASYTGDPTHSGSTSESVPITITQAATSVTISSSLNPSMEGLPVTFIAKVSGSGPVTPGGTVVFSDGSNAFGTPQTVFNGSANISTSSLSAGSHSISAAYSGDANYTSAASIVLKQVVDGGASQTVLQSSPNPSVVGQPVSLSVSVSSQQGVPSGSVRLLDGQAQIAIVSLTNGAGAFSTSSLTVGPHTLSAVYGGDSTHAGSTSPAVVQTVNNVSTVTLTLTSAPNPSTVGQAVVFTAAVSSAGGATPTGSVTISEGATVYGSGTLVGGKALISTSSIPVGIHEIRATYGGDGTHSGATSEPVVQTVN